MSEWTNEFLDKRVEEITRELLEKDGRYAVAAEWCGLLFDNLASIVEREGDITISAGDCADFLDYFELDYAAEAILHRALYRQGYLDGIKLLAAPDLPM